VNPADNLNLEKRLRRLEAIESIRALKARYTEGADRKNDPRILMPLFAEDAVWEAEGFGRHEGKKAIENFLVETVKRIVWTFHYMLPQEIEVGESGLTARGRWYLWELASMRSDEASEPRAVWVAGVYEDEFVNIAGQWKFKTVRLRPVVITPFEEGWLKTPMIRF
jgi:limonene-1,2-epoxide hydrolase